MRTADSEHWSDWEITQSDLSRLLKTQIIMLFYHAVAHLRWKRFKFVITEIAWTRWILLHSVTSLPVQYRSCLTTQVSPNVSTRFCWVLIFASYWLYLLPVIITKTCLYNFDPLKPHFYVVKLGFRGVYIIILISAQKHRLWYSLEPPAIYVLSRNMKNIRVFYLKIFSFWRWNFLYIWIGVFS